ncbi:hypothetical protein M422DRAFT_774277 [Sphaerobolus stellatus SS14]|nr:hypothetical protein M422DRAFT_774277 [Sphaerobolus stellatus SS14]
MAFSSITEPFKVFKDAGGTRVPEFRLVKEVEGVLAVVKHASLRMQHVYLLKDFGIIEIGHLVPGSYITNIGTYAAAARIHMVYHRRVLCNRERSYHCFTSFAMFREVILQTSGHMQLQQGFTWSTIEESCVIVKEVTTASPPSPSNPLKIITGRRNHSAGQVGVLGPAVRETLVHEVYSVTKWDAEFVNAE